MAALVAIPMHAYHLNDTVVAIQVLLALGGCFLLEYFFLFVRALRLSLFPNL